MFVISSAWYILGIFTKNGEFSTLNSEAQSLLENERDFFRNELLNTNTDGGGYTTNGAAKEDENHDDDDFYGEQYDTDGEPDNDGTAFMYKFGFVLPNKKENIFFLNKKYTDITGFMASSLSWFNIFSDHNADCTMEIYDGNIYEETRNFKLKTKKTQILQSSVNFISISSSDILPNDIILIFITNDTNDLISYSIGWVDLQGKNIVQFMPANNKDRNVDIYTNIILKDKDGNYIVFDTTFYDILPQGKKPISPTYLHIKSSTGTTLELEWDINDTTNTGAYYLYRWSDSSVDCNEQYFLEKIPDGDKENSISIQYDSGIFYYTLCGSNSSWSWSGLEDIGHLSLKSNTLRVTK